ncbi:Ion transport 2 domain protein [Caldalkalibacillus thermarum TA2.A1]|uniref:Ion transport 2 domain protein n=2 Tax=Caldalkalibacillus thermarum (strain TA2.A1) TaxID=986075 RepID=F5L4X8_CALTT|nr:potassium channel family protein [Caldalkalibacillus thermarum]EGL83591.1 Ion transport 2 domain protein [Caldalkalibacillus thermarum TA2.A1]
MILFFRQNHRKRMLTNLGILAIFYANVVVTFAFIYFVLDITGLGAIIDHYSPLPHQDEHWLDRMINSLYFSVITLFSVGYGDVTPFGLSRGVAILQAMFGYILPAVVVIQYLRMNESDT